MSIQVSDPEKSKRFYNKALEPLGYKLVVEIPDEKTGNIFALGYGPPSDAIFWVGPGKPHRPIIHIAFSAKNRKQVDEFYKAALAADGKDNGVPGLRPQYHENYYGAFVLDPDGNNIEAVCHTPEKS